jgi:hypothetical protein
LSEIARVNGILLARFTALVLFAFWPLNPYSDPEALPDLLPMSFVDHPLVGEPSLIVNTDYNGGGLADIVAYGDLHSGLGPNWKSESLVVRWPNGAPTIMEQPYINQRLKVAS